MIYSVWMLCTVLNAFWKHLMWTERRSVCLCITVKPTILHKKSRMGFAYIRAFPTNMFDLINIRPVEHSRTEAGRRRWPASPSPLPLLSSPSPPPLLSLSSSSPLPLLLSLSLVLVSLSRPLARQEPDLSNVLGLLSQVHTPLPVCLSYWFSPLPHGLSLWIFSARQVASSTPPFPNTQDVLLRVFYHRRAAVFLASSVFLRRPWGDNQGQVTLGHGEGPYICSRCHLFPSAGRVAAGAGPIWLDVMGSDRRGPLLCPRLAGQRAARGARDTQAIN